MSQIFRHRNRDKVVNILLHPEGKLLFGFGKILYQPKKDFDKTEIHF
jgi:hypothetical protein